MTTTVLTQIAQIVHTGFPLPSIPVPSPSIHADIVASTPPSSRVRESQQELGLPGVADDEMDEVDEDDGEDDENQPPHSSQNSSKENEAPMGRLFSTPTFPRRPPVPGPRDSPPQTLQRLGVDRDPGGLPPDLLSLYQSTTRILERDFAHSPPYTIQRLAEMVLYPKNHYNFLPAFLRALDRIVSVSSPISDFPLPTLNASVNGGGFLTNGDSTQANGVTVRDGLGSDESLGGALLTPIPWLRNHGVTSESQHDGELHSEGTETTEGPNGARSLETVSTTVNGVQSAMNVLHPPPDATPGSPSEQSDTSSESTDAQLRLQGGVTQGELLRQEQEAGVIPATQPILRRALVAHGAAAVGRDANAMPINANVSEAEDDHVHARGPEEVGMEDMGPQPESSGELNIEAAVGRARSPPVQQPLPSSVMLKTDVGDDAGGPGKDPKDVDKEVERLRELMDAKKEQDAQDADGDVVVADASGQPVD